MSNHNKIDSDSSLYFQQDSFDMDEYKSRMQSLRKKKKDTFGSEPVDVNKYILSPDGMEGLVISIYVLLIPYIVGAIVLFLFVAGSDIDKFLILDLTTFFIVWAIGYEVVATFLLLAIFYSYLKYMGCCSMSPDVRERTTRRKRNK